MPDIDFSQIKGFKRGQRDSFEELVCQLAQREKHPAAAQFRRVDGAGGDGGVEAYWVYPGGEKHGYQAKYFLRTGDIDWSQVDKSVVQALETHPTLSSYTVAFPCNLTDRAGTKGRGKTGWEHWEGHVAAWRTHAKSLGMSEIEFRPWTESDLVARLAKPAAAGLRMYWFGGTEFTSDWFARHAESAVALLDERFHPEDHVNVSLQTLFRVVSRDPSVVRELKAMIGKIGGTVVPNRSLVPLEIPQELTDKIEAAKASLVEIEPEFSFEGERAWNSEVWVQRANELQSAIGDMQSWQWVQEREEDESKSNDRRDHLRSLRNDVSALSDLVDTFHAFVDRKYFKAERDRYALIEGAAGSGKSHLFGHKAEEAAKRGQPVVLLLGQQFADGEPWAQISALLDMSGTSGDTILGALNAAAEANRTRGLLLVDGVNEGIGSQFWKNHLAGFLARVKNYPHLACVLSCRSEYVPHAFATELLARAARFTVNGFATPEEQANAARVYLDRRGIARPSTPWLAPEFINPLFLRSTCLALARDGKKEFPRGLQGTNAILSYYLDSAGRHLNAGHDGSDELVGPTKKAVLGIAKKMADLRADYLSRVDALQIADECFFSYAAPAGKTWLDVLRLAGLFRHDPAPGNSEADPMDPAPDVVRFCFQRFQDHLMGQALLADIDDISAAFANEGKLAYVLAGDKVDWRWSGLFEALATLVPEKFALELVDVLPGSFEKWWWSFAPHFVESAKWRAHGAFSERSLELLNHLQDSYEDRTALLIELSVSAGHPWNADLLHKNLMPKGLSERDAFWTVVLNGMSEEEDSPAGRLMDWCLVGQTDITAIENQRLAGVMLCWFFTSSNRGIRDKATKALASVLIAREELFPELLATFAQVNDLYVLERLLAAGFAACTLDQTEQRCRSYSLSVFKSVFKGGKPPLGILVRDYALGIIELAESRDLVPADVDVSLCKPPYLSPRPIFRITEDQLKVVAEKAGSDEILRSSTGFMGDFAQYEIKSRVRSFLEISLTKDLPLTAEQRLAKFSQEVVDGIAERRAAFAALEKIANPYWAGIKTTPFETRRPASRAAVDAWRKRVKATEDAFMALLSPAELERYRSEAQEKVLHRPVRTKKKPENLDPRKVQRWVANRAYQLGWTERRFPNDRASGMRYSRDRPRTERIGKKYQWLALDELLCRLADNFWLDPDYGSLPRHYKNPHDIGFHRDIDPTILTPVLSEPTLEQTGPENWVGAPWIALENVTESQLPGWPFSTDPHAEFAKTVQRTDGQGKKWTVLYEHQSTENSYGEGSPALHGLRQQEFRFIYSVQVRKSLLKRFIDEILAKKSLDVSSWEPRSFTDEQFLGEAPWRSNWPQKRWSIDNWHVSAEIDLAFPVFQYQWESHLDVSLAEGARCHLPAPWFAKQLGLSPGAPGIWKNATGVPAFVSYGGDRHNQCVLVDSDTLPTISDGGATVMVWLLIAERNAWPGGHNDNAAWRRTEGICWPHGNTLRSRTWNQDSANGSSKELLTKTE